MADLTVTAAQLRIIESIEARLIPMIANVAITKGQAVYRLSTGKAGLARANSASTSKVVGIATTDAAAGSAFEALYHGRLAGYTLGDPGTTVYLSTDTAGALQDDLTVTVGEVVVPIGTVHTMTDGSSTEFLFVDVPQNGNYAAIPAP
jgi:L-ascorbate metabolism protein UlaG (beta-lactamase superfamily)